DLVSLPIFNLSIPHGQKPQQAGYAYIVMPGIASPASLKSYDPAIIEILSNTPELQAVHHKQLDMLQAVFYAPGEITVGSVTLKADRPCVMLAKKLSSEHPEVISKGPGEE
ncbi:MAG: polysaccharide lyase beta-sandwich domain-containing protein, partial [Bacteroides sp.]